MYFCLGQVFRKEGVGLSFMRTIGRIGARLASNKEFISGIMEGMDPQAIASAINENAHMMGQVVKYLDPKAVAESMNEGIAFAGEVIRYIDPKAVAEIINKNERILPRYIECISPNVFTRSAGTVFQKLRYATYKPQMFQRTEEEKTV